MKTTLYLSLSVCLLFTFSCGDTSNSSPDPSTTHVQDMKTKLDVESSDTGNDIDTPKTSLPRGELIDNFDDVPTPVTETTLRHTETELFVSANNRYVLWTPFKAPELTLLYTWADRVMPPPPALLSTDFSISKNRIWFQARIDDTQVGVIGVNRTPYVANNKGFGEPVVILTGMGRNFSGIQQWKNGSAFGGIRALNTIPNQIIFAKKDEKNISIEVPGFSPLSTFHPTSTGAAYIYQNAIWKIDAEKKKVNRLTTLDQIHDIRTTPTTFFVRTESGLGKFPIDCTAPCITEKLTKGFSPQNWDASDEIVAWNEGKIIRSYQNGKLSSIAESSDQILSILVKKSAIYWTTPKGLFLLK